MKIRGYFLLFLVQATTILAKVPVPIFVDDTALSTSAVITGCPRIPILYPFFCFKECYTDLNCKPGLKCCSNGCVSHCVVPVTYSCTPQKYEVIKYCKSRCNLCKFGSSSDCLTILPPLCRAECERDEECPAGRKCCMSLCSKKCVKPTAVAPIHKYGYCPIPAKDLITPCIVFCNNDAECPGAQKCCSHGCTVKCMEPDYPGSCPHESAGDFWFPCRKYCSYDSNCSKGSKCCKLGCTTKCTRAIFPELI